jgi:PhnB protein
MNVSAHIVVPDAAAACAWYEKAFGAREQDRIPLPGGKVVSARIAIGGRRGSTPARRSILGERHGQLVGPFGHRWNVARRLRDVPHDEVVRAAAKAFGGG